MTRRWKILLWLIVVLAFLGLIGLFLGPVLFASVAYPLPSEYQSSVDHWSREYKIDQNLMCAMIMTESGWNANAASGAGAVGMTQFIPSTAVAVAKRLGVSPFSPNDLKKNPDLAIRFGAYYLSDAIKRYGDVKKALISYNGGGGAVIAYERGYPVRGTVGYAQKILTIQGLYYRIYGRWWEGATSGSGGSESKPSFTVKPKLDISIVGDLPVVDFWRNLLPTSGTIDTTTNATGGSDSVDNLWKTFLPGT